MKKLIYCFGLATLMGSCQKEKPLGHAGVPSFSAPLEQNAIMQKVNAFNRLYENAQAGITVNESLISTQELEWTLEAAANYRHTKKMVQTDALHKRSFDISLPVQQVKNGTAVLLADAMQAFAQIDQNIKAYTAQAKPGYYYQYSDVSVLNLSSSEVKLRIEEVRAYEVTGRIGSDFVSGDSYPIYSSDANNAADKTEAKLTPFFYNRATTFYGCFVTNIQWEPSGTPFYSYHIIAQNPYIAPCSAGGNIYFGTDGLLANFHLNSTWDYNALNTYKDNLGNFLHTYQTTWQSTWEVLEVDLIAHDLGYIQYTTSDQVANPCYPNSYRYYHYLRWKKGTLSCSGGGS